MQVAFWGVRGSIPTPSPTHLGFGGNTACVTVSNDAGNLLVLDAGSGIRPLGKRLLEANGMGPITGAILISHFHWDHIMGIPFFLPLYRPNSRFAFVSFRHPESSFQEIIEVQMKNPYFPISMNEMAGHREFYEIGEQCVRIGDYVVTSRRLNHPQGCLGYRIECGERVVTYATDHEPDAGPYDANLLQLAFDADLLILDSQFTRDEYEQGRQGWGHGNWEAAVELARSARVRQLVLFHHDPDRTDDEIHQIVRQAQHAFPWVSAAFEGMGVDLAERHPVKETECVPPLATGEILRVEDDGSRLHSAARGLATGTTA